MIVTQPMGGNPTALSGHAPYLPHPQDLFSRAWRDVTPHKQSPSGEKSLGSLPRPYSRAQHSQLQKQPAQQAEAPQTPQSTISSWLHQARRELTEIDAEAAEEGFPNIRAEAKEEAHRILLALSGTPAVTAAVFPTMDGEVAIQFNSLRTSGAVVIEVGNEGGGACFASIGGRNRRARYSDASDLPDEFVRAQLLALALPELHEPHVSATP